MLETDLVKDMTEEKQKDKLDNTLASITVLMFFVVLLNVAQTGTPLEMIASLGFIAILAVILRNVKKL